MAIGFALLLVFHGLIHLLGAAKGLGVAQLPQLTQPISPAMAIGWLVSAGLFLIAALSLHLWPRWWWVIALSAVIASTFVIIPSWADAKFGVVANVIILVGIVFGFLSQGPFSLRAEYDADIANHVSAVARTTPVTEADLAHLPDPVQRYLTVAGVLGQPRVRNFRVRMHGRIREGREGRWMPFSAEQYNNLVSPAARLFYLNATMFGIPVQGYHRYVGPTATMRVKAAALVAVATAGAEVTQAETVTLFNDLCVMAPATLVDAAVEWEPVDANTVGATFTNAGHTIRAMLMFNDAGELVDFVSDDRVQVPSGGAAAKSMRWSTPVRAYRWFGAARLASGGHGRWHDEQGDYAYIEVTIDDVIYNVPPP